MSKGVARSGLVFREPLIFEQSVPGRQGHSLPVCEVEAPARGALPEALQRDAVEGFPELSEPQVFRHFLRLSQWNYSIDSGLFPLGSCTMKYNPKVNEAVARLPGFAGLHPAQDDDTVQGALAIFYALEKMLMAVSGMDAVSLHPAAGAQGELTGLMTIRAFHTANGNPRSKVLIPDSAHGTNPASAAICDYKVVTVKSDERGLLTADAVRALLDDEVAALMITNPNTLGLFEPEIAEIAAALHEVGAQLYIDGANLNAIMGITRPGDQGADVMHFNLHKTFTTPHGGGGPGAGPVGVKAHLAPFLPAPRVRLEQGEAADVPLDLRDIEGRFVFERDGGAQTIGRVRSYHANFGMLVRAYTYIREMGPEGLKRASQMAVLNANYLKARLQDRFQVAVDRDCMHEVVFSDKGYPDGVKTLDVAKRLMDYGYHAPTVYFPLVVRGALMMEPTETESKTTLDEFVDALRSVRQEMEENPELLTSAPHTPIVRRLDEVQAARHPHLRWSPEAE